MCEEILFITDETWQEAFAGTETWRRRIVVAAAAASPAATLLLTGEVGICVCEAKPLKSLGEKAQPFLRIVSVRGRRLF